MKSIQPMLRIIEFLVEAVYWLLIFLSPVLVMGLLALLLYFECGVPAWISYVLLGVGVVLGVWLAEHVRRKYGCSNFWSRTSATPDID